MSNRPLMRHVNPQLVIILRDLSKTGTTLGRPAPKKGGGYRGRQSESEQSEFQKRTKRESKASQMAEREPTYHGRNGREKQSAERGEEKRKGNRKKLKNGRGGQDR
jgi:hypothetical protein